MNQFRKPGGPVRQPYSHSVPSPHRLFKKFEHRYLIPEGIHLLFQDIVAQERDLFTGRVLHLPEKPILHGHHRQLFPNIPHGRNILLYVHIYYSRPLYNNLLNSRCS
jgi:hypothetical protein